MEQRKITKGMQEVLESPEFIKTQTQIVDIMQKYRLFTAQLDETFERIRVPMQALNAALYDATSPLHGMCRASRELYLKYRKNSREKGRKLGNNAIRW